MCTMIWMFRDDGYELFFNRDELRTRLIAFPPELRIIQGVSVIAPTDADAGGTWMGVNEFGVSVCLLNGYGQTPKDQVDFTSRGLLVSSLLGCKDQSEIRSRLAALDVAAYRPFMLVVFEPQQSVLAWAWNGADFMTQADVDCPLISSSVKLVTERRRQLFDTLNPQSSKALTDYHRSHVPEASAFSVCMHRDDAQTVSLSRVVVTEHQVGFYYTPGPPCQTDFLPPLFLPRTGTQ